MMAASCESCARRDICPMAAEDEACEHYIEGSAENK